MTAKTLFSTLIIIQLIFFACTTDNVDGDDKNSKKLTCSITGYPTKNNFEFNNELTIYLKFEIVPELQVGNIVVWINQDKYKELPLSAKDIYIPAKSLNAGKNSIVIRATDNKTETSANIDLYMRVKTGDFFGGGVVFFTDKDGYTGLISTPNDLQGGTLNRFQYANAFQLYRVDATSLTDGKSNTDKLKGFDESAARFCYYHEGGGFLDWYLPAYEELQVLRNAGFLDYDPYWSSTELSATEAKISTGYIQLESQKKTTKFRIRAVRQF